MEEEYQVEIPSYFVCPISMQLMKDPVTISTGITYDRQSIEKWLFKNTTCPVTRHPLSAVDLTPNHTLRRLIQAWCTLNALERIPTPKQPLDKSHILNLLNQANTSPNSLLHCLQRLRSSIDTATLIHLQASGAAAFLLSVVRENEDAAVRDEALAILHQMELSDSDLKSFFSDSRNGVTITNALVHVLQNGDSQSRARALTLLQSAFSVADPVHLIGSKPEVFIQTVQILKDRISQQTTKAAAKLLVELCPWGKNRVKAVEAGAVAALIELLLETADRRSCEVALTVLDQLCGCADGRAEVVRHGAGLAVVSKKILRVSAVASERGVRIIGSIARYGANSRVVQEMMEVGVVSKLCLVLQVDASQKTKDRIKEILRLHSRVWKHSSCIPPHLLSSSYPS